MSPGNWLLPAANAADAAEAQRLVQSRVAAPLGSLVLSPAAAAALIAAQPGPPAGELPPNLHLMSLDRVQLESSPATDAGRTVLRIRHMFQQGEHPTWSEAATCDLTKVPRFLNTGGAFYNEVFQKNTPRTQ